MQPALGLNHALLSPRRAAHRPLSDQSAPSPAITVVAPILWVSATAQDTPEKELCMLVTVTREQALTAAAALRQTGDEQTASTFERASVQLWVLQGADEDGYNTYLGYN